MRWNLRFILLKVALIYISTLSCKNRPSLKKTLSSAQKLNSLGQGITFGNTDDESDDFRFGGNENVSENIEEVKNESSSKRQ